MSLKATVTLGFDVNRTSSPDIGSSSYQSAAAWAKTLLDGVGLNQVNKVFVDKVTLAGSGTVTYDLDSGALADPSGVSGGVVAAFSRIVAIFIRRTNTPAATTQDENVKLHGDFILTKFLSPGGDTLVNVSIPIRPGGIFAYIAPDATGVAVTASTGDQITLTNESAGDSTDLEVVILGS